MRVTDEPSPWPAVYDLQKQVAALSEKLHTVETSLGNEVMKLVADLAKQLNGGEYQHDHSGKMVDLTDTPMGQELKESMDETRDADRYRWIRAHPDRCVDALTHVGFACVSDPNLVDASIDETMRINP